MKSVQRISCTCTCILNTDATSFTGTENVSVLGVPFLMLKLPLCDVSGVTHARTHTRIGVGRCYYMPRMFIVALIAVDSVLINPLCSPSPVTNNTVM